MLWLLTRLPYCFPSFQNLGWKKCETHVLEHLHLKASPFNTSHTTPYKAQVKEVFDNFILGNNLWPNLTSAQVTLEHKIDNEVDMDQYEARNVRLNSK